MSALQEEFSQSMAALIQQAKLLDYGVTMGECYRTPQQAQLNAQSGAGIANSLHTQRLAVDLNLFVNGEYQTDDTQQCYSTLGTWWKQLGPSYYWGGDFTKRDYNHFSLSPDGGKTR